MGTDLKGKRLPSGISQRKDGRYVARYTDRFGKRKSIYGKSVSKLQKRLNELTYKDGIGETVFSGVLLDEWYENWKELYLDSADLSLSTQSSYEMYYRRYVKDNLGFRKLDEIRAIHIREFFNILSTDLGLRQSTISGIKGLLSKLFNTAVENELMNRNPVQNIPIPKTREPRMIYALTKEEQNTLLDYCDESSYGNFIKAQLSTGMRCGELASIKMENIDFDGKIITVTNTVAYRKVDGKMGYYLTKPKTKASIRKIPMSELFCKAIEDELKKGKKISPKFEETDFDGLIFITDKGFPICPQYYNRELRAISEKLSTEAKEFPRFTSHSLRHTFCTRLIEKNVNPKYVQSVMGHSNIRQTLERYAHAQDECFQTVLEELNDIF